MKVLRGDGTALEQTMTLMVNRIPTRTFYDPCGLFNSQDIDLLKREAIWKGLHTYDHSKGAELETWLITYMRRYVLDKLQWKRRSKIEAIPLEADFLESISPPVKSTDIVYETHIQILRGQFERALLDQARPVAQDIYRLRRERPWISVEELADTLGCSRNYIRIQLKVMEQLAGEVYFQIIQTMREFGITMEV